jgi:hypothetical protein
MRQKISDAMGKHPDKQAHGRFTLGCHIRQRQLPIHRQTLLGRMTTESLQLGADHTLPRQIRHAWMAKQMRIDALGNPSGRGILLDNLAKPPG